MQIKELNVFEAGTMLLKPDPIEFVIMVKFNCILRVDNHGLHL